MTKDGYGNPLAPLPAGLSFRESDMAEFVSGADLDEKDIRACGCVSDGNVTLNEEYMRMDWERKRSTPWATGRRS